MTIEQEILRNSKSIAVVGLSSDTSKPSYRVANYLKGAGYRIIPVNPNESEVLGEICYPNLTSIPEPVDLVDIFRLPKYVTAIVEEAIKISAKAVWMQEKIINEEAASRAREAGLKVVMNRCTYKEHIKMAKQN